MPPPSIADFFLVQRSEPTLQVLGEIDAVNADELREHLDRLVESADGQVVLDLSGVTYCGTLGTRIIRQAARRCEHDGVRMDLLASASMQRALDRAPMRSVRDRTSAPTHS